MDPWEQHKDVLRTLYSSKDRNIGTLRSIMAHMEAKHGFVRNKGQFERQFKKWGFRKNSTSEHWKTIHGKIQKRHAQGKKSAVYKSGKHVQVDKLNKEKRHNFRKAEELFNSGQSSQIACCVEKYCQHAMEELPGTPAGFTVCTPMGDTTPPLLINNLPSLQLFGQLRSFVSSHMNASQHPHNRTASAGAEPFAHSLFDKQAVNSARTEGTVSVATSDEEDCNNDGDWDLILLNEWKMDGENVHDLFKVSRTGELSASVLPMLHLASNNLLSKEQASSVVDLIRLGSGRQVFNALVSKRSPATRAIARSLLPAAIQCLDVELVRSLLDTGVSPDAPTGSSLQTPLQFAIAGGNLDEGILDLVQLLLAYGAQVNLHCAKFTSSPLVYAAGQGHLGLVQLLLAAGGDVDAHANTGETTALRAAAGEHVGGVRKWQAAEQSDRLEIAQLLLNAGVDVNANSYGAPWQKAASEAAVSHEDVSLVPVILPYDTKVSTPPFWGRRTALQAAASAGNLEMINLLLKWGALGVVAAIECAFRYGHGQAAQALLSFGAGLDVIDNDAYKVMALKVGIRHGDCHFVQSLLECNVDLDAWTDTNLLQRTTALQEAATEGNMDLVRLLISFGADVNAAAAGVKGQTALQIAARRGHSELVQLLLGAGADVNSDSSLLGKMALPAAVSAGNPEIVQLLLDSGADVYLQGAAAVFETAVVGREPSNSFEIRQLLLDRFPSCGVENSKCVYGFDEVINCELMPLLLHHGIIEGGSALRYAIDNRDIGLVKLALDFGADVNAGQRYPNEWWILEAAVITDMLEIVQLLLENEANPQEKARALQAAAYEGFFEAVEVLVDAGADVNAAPTGYFIDRGLPEDRTALQAAAQQGHLDVVRLLLENGAEAERSSISADEEGTALQFAAIAGSIAIANELIQRGANVNAAPLGEDGRTALEGAAEHGRLDMVQLLLNLEAEVRGSRALQFARKEGHDGVVMLLLENGFQDDVQMSG